MFGKTIPLFGDVLPALRSYGDVSADLMGRWARHHRRGSHERPQSKCPGLLPAAANGQMTAPRLRLAEDSDPGKYLLLDGHLRIDALKDMGKSEVTCLISTDDEAFTYNKRVNRLAMIRKHRMIVKAVQQGVPEERIAKALNVDVQSIIRKRKLLDGICADVSRSSRTSTSPSRRSVNSGTRWSAISCAASPRHSH